MTRARHLSRASAVCLLVVAASGCVGSRSGGAGGGLSGAAFPEHLAQRETLDIQVVRDETHISFTNTSARAIGPGRVWVNRFYSLPIDRVGVGESRRLDLRDFRSEFGDRFRAGGFFATRSPKNVVQVQVRETGAAELIGLVLVAGPEDDR